MWVCGREAPSMSGRGNATAAADPTERMSGASPPAFCEWAAARDGDQLSPRRRSRRRLARGGGGGGAAAAGGHLGDEARDDAVRRRRCRRAQPAAQIEWRCGTCRRLFGGGGEGEQLGGARRDERERRRARAPASEGRWEEGGVGGE
ncbi:hypothetical protein AB1Y20_015331 [Prymnesium parvum]|uniref:Uncharacterized protein n=1 Tax=Prymnesium parvum TaxID=97485 RepID=A0AB34JZU4_PRYPA